MILPSRPFGGSPDFVVGKIAPPSPDWRPKISLVAAIYCRLLTPLSAQPAPFMKRIESSVRSTRDVKLNYVVVVHSSTLRRPIWAWRQ